VFLSRFVADRFPWACALWLHLALYAVLTDAATWRLPVPLPPDPVEVDIVPEVRARPTLPAPPAQSAAKDIPGAAQATAQPGTGPVVDTGKTWVTATRFLAADVLRDPRSRQAREALATLTGADGREQVCALEAMEQLRRDKADFRPTRLAPHAFKNAVFRKGMIHVTAGAVRSNRIWYEIAYRCRLGADESKIIGFEYALGAPVDRALWDEHGLAPIH